MLGLYRLPQQMFSVGEISAAGSAGRLRQKLLFPGISDFA